MLVTRALEQLMKGKKSGDGAGSSGNSAERSPYGLKPQSRAHVWPPTWKAPERTE
jgi:hypothetical protein